MLFNSYEFILFFLPITVAVFYAFSRFDSRTHSLGFLAVASLFFYGWWNPSYLILISASLIINFVLGIALQKEDKKNTWNRFVLLVGIIFNLGFLGYYKYAGFLVEVFNDVNNENIYWDNIVLPLAISFFTFQQIAYLIDSYAGRVKESNFLEYTIFVTFFPQLIAGPIVHHKEMMPQFKSLALKITRENLQVGVAFFAIGLFKKVILADSIAEQVSPIYDEAALGSITFFQAWIAGLGFTLQIYFDFSGYSDMALGAARMFGIILPINFNSPLKASNIIGFWSRWHMTLTRLLTDYIYTPLAIMATRRAAQKKFKQKRIRKTYEFIIILALPTLFTMLLSGIWHGAGYQFIVFGLLHGSYLVINHVWRAVISTIVTDKKKYEQIFYPIGVLITLFSVCLSMLFFRADNIDISYQMAASMLGLNGISLPEGIYVHLGALHELLSSIGVTVDTTAGSAITSGALYCIALFVIALFFPNSLDIMRNFKPALEYAPKVSAKHDLLFNNKITNFMVWKPNITWGIAMGIIIAIGLMSLQGFSVFLYWQF